MDFLYYFLYLKYSALIDIIQAISILLAEKYPSIFGNATDMHAKSTVTNAVAIHAKNKI